MRYHNFDEAGLLLPVAKLLVIELGTYPTNFEQKQIIVIGNFGYYKIMC